MNTCSNLSWSRYRKVFTVPAKGGRAYDCQTVGTYRSVFKGEVLSRELVNVGGEFQRQEDRENFMWRKMNLVCDRVHVRALTG